MDATDFASKISRGSSMMPDFMRKDHDKMRAKMGGMRSMGRRGTTMKRCSTRSSARTRQIAVRSGMYAREIVSGLSPQQINPIKVRLAKAETDGFVPAYSVLFNNNLATLRCTASNSADLRTPLGVMLEDGSEPKNNLAVVTTSGLVPLLCPVEQAKKFQWGDFVGVRCNTMVRFGHADTNPSVALVFPIGQNPEPGEMRIGKFMGWPTNNPKDGGILVKVDIKK
jgi:hypothetical protein